ncbi:MAG: response regulator transcription factor [Bacteroidaceae bacterium]|nr:response regulator transcription factor [Bacteroidaceae bacterium]
MESIRCMVIDDEPLAVEMVKNFITRTPFLQFTASYTDAVDALTALKEHPVDLLFLDINMPDLDGMSLAAMVPPETRIIFTTAFKEYAFESYNVNALDFLLKPINYARFLAAAEKARQWFELNTATHQVSENKAEMKRNTLFIRIDGELKQIDISQILYVSGLKNYVMFYMENEQRPLVTHLTMKAVEDILPPDDFMRVHRSYIVALHKISSVDRNNTIHIGKEFIHVSDSYLDSFNKYIQANQIGL